MGLKPDIGAQYRQPPQRTYDQEAFKRLVSGYNDLTGTFERRSRGEDVFDYIKYLFEPQKTYLNQEYGITGDPSDIYSSRTGVLPQTLASMNAKGLLDTGTSGLVEGQIRSNASNKIAELFGNAKQLQRQDIDDALATLHTLYPENFNIADIPHSIAYGNAIGNYNVDMARTAAQTAYEQSQGPKTLFGQMAPLIGQVAGTAIGSLGGPGGAMIGGQIGGQLGVMGQRNAAGSTWSGGGSNDLFGGLDFSSIFGGKNKSTAKSTSNAYGGAGLEGYNYNPFSGTPNYSANNVGASNKYYGPSNISW